MDWLTDTPLLTKERGFLLRSGTPGVFYTDPLRCLGFYTDPYNYC